ncbi:radical SAM protein [Spirochaetota bacterium]
MKYLFGPVNSRRLGISLGIDLIPHKVCSYNCVYCECGETTDITSDIFELVPTGEVIDEIDMYLKNKPRLDVVTFSGTGEPTLHSGIGRIIGHIKKKFPQYKVAVLTNGSLLWKPVVRKSLEEADVVIPSLDGVTAEVFNSICRPADGLKPEKIIDGMVAFRSEFKGEVIVEVFIIPGVNDMEAELEKIKEVCRKINPHMIQLNSMDRPGTEDWVLSSGEERMVEIKKYFEPLEVEIIGMPAENGQKLSTEKTGDTFKKIISLLERRPSTFEEICESTGGERFEVESKLNELLKRNTVRIEEQARGKFYVLC